jgi:phosphoglycolate phosphatase
MTIKSDLPHGRYDAAIIDLDGTMVDTMGDFVVAINLMLHDIGYNPVDRDVVALRVGKGSESLVKSVLNHAKCQLIPALIAPERVATFEHALALYQQHYRRINGQHAEVYPDVVRGLLALQKAGLNLACLTNKPVAFARELLRLKGLNGYFSQVFGGDSFGAKKPDALPVLRTCEALGALPAHTLMVGDSSNDAKAARAAGCPVVLVTYGYNHGEPVASAAADATISSFVELESLLARAAVTDSLSR